MVLTRWSLLGLSSMFGAVTPLLLSTVAQADTMDVLLRSREPGVVVRPAEWDPAETAVIVCDMWDSHTCEDSLRRVGELAPFMDTVLDAARERGMSIIHAPSECMEAYAGTPARQLAQDAPFAQAPTEFRWRERDPEREPELPVREGCDSDGDGAKWTSQHSAIGIEEGDALTDDGQEVFNLLVARGIKQVIIMGVHTNVCVLGRPFGIRQMVYNGIDVALCRDLTDTYHRDPGRHFQGLDRVVEHIEEYWCPTITSRAITGESPFIFPGDGRRHLVMILADQEYESERTLPLFAAGELADEYRVSYVTWPQVGASNLPGLDILSDADIVLVSAWRRALPPDQMAAIRAYVDSVKPIVGVRCASHAFVLRAGSDVPEGLVEWPEFDHDVWGGHYTGHLGNNHDGHGPPTMVHIAPGRDAHPILEGIPGEEFPVRSWLYLAEPLTASATALMYGSVEGEGPPQPVAWTNMRDGGGRAFYTSLGHPGDFDIPAVRALLLNGIRWADGALD